MDHRAVCFVIMPFGRKADPSGRIVDFDRIYAAMIAPAIEAAGLAVVRADEEKGAGFIHKLMYERILLSDFAIADLTILNANVYYELGIRHAARPETTVLTMALGSPLPFDVGPLRALPYALSEDGAPADAVAASAALTQRLIEARGHREPCRYPRRRARRGIAGAHSRGCFRVGHDGETRGGDGQARHDQ